MINNSKSLLLQNLIYISLLLFVAGCNGTSSKTNKLGLVANDPPIDLSELNVNFYKGIKYGKSKDNSFDLILPKADYKTPLVIFIHGGGFVGGDKSHAYKNEYPKQIRALLTNKIAFATINYRFITDSASNGVITSLNDSKRCLQFIRYHSEELNIDKEKIGIYGSSAGAGTSMWIGLHDDMREISSEDPIEGESTRINAVGALEPFNITFEKLTKSGMHKTILSFYRIDNLDELYSKKMITYRENIDFLKLMSNDDPPIWVKNAQYEAGIPQSKKELNHHPFHAKVLKEHAEKIRLESLFYIPKLGIKDSSGLDLVEFMINKLK